MTTARPYSGVVHVRWLVNGVNWSCGCCHWTRGVWRATARVTTWVHVAVLWRFGELLTVELVLGFAQLMTRRVVGGQRDVDEAVVSRGRVVVRVVRAQGPVLEEVLRCCQVVPGI